MPKQRVVVKDSSFNDLPQKVQMWKNRKWFWSRDRNNDLIPTEIKTMFGRIGQEYNAKILSWRMSRQRRWHRIYMAFYPLRNLVSVVEQAIDANEEIPEPFMWYCAEALATAGATMLQGDLEANAVSEWRPILHRDLKISNVLLDNPLLHPYSRYPTPKVCDFGYSTYNQRDGDHTIQTDGTLWYKGCSAPEAIRPELGPYTSKSDVWAFAP